MNPTEKKHISKIVYADDLVMRGYRTSARFNGQRLEITRGRTTWQIPTAAIESIERRRGTVHITLSGEPAPDQRTPPLRFRTASTPNATRFTERIERSLLAEDTAPNGYALVTTDQRPGRLHSRTARWTAVAGLSSVLYVGAGFIPHPSFGNALALAFGWSLGGIGCFFSYMVATRGIIYSIILWRRSVTVTGRAFGSGFTALTFTTVEGDHYDFADSADLGTDAYGEVEITYDPRRPHIARPRVSYSHYLVLAFACFMAPATLGGSTLFLLSVISP